MDYKLAKKLKDAGFPQFVGDFQGEIIEDHSALEGEEPLSCYQPTLEELIEACKGRILKLWVLADGRGGVQLEGESLTDVEYYPSLKEAVANLWLVINKK